MSVKKKVNVIIGDRMYTLSGYEEKEYLEQVASYINKKIDEGKALEYWKNLGKEMQTVLIGINMADDYFKARDRVTSLEDEMKHKDQEVYNLKHDLVQNQVKTQDLEDRLKSLEEENRELKLNKTKLEASLEDALLGTPDDGAGKKND